MAHLQLKNICKEYPGRVQALDAFNLDVLQGELVVVVGPSGCGKSTLLRLIAGLEEVGSGQIVLKGKKINDLPPKDRNVAMMFQNYVLFPHMTVFDNMAFGLKLRGVKRADIKKRVEKIAGVMKITELLQRYPRALSGGQRQRAALGRAILRQPEVFLLDEPLSNLDAKMRTQMRIEISKLHKDLKATMVFVTHDQTEAMTMGDRIVVLNGGKIQQVADPMTLYNNPENKFVAGFIGTPAMNFLEGEVVHQQGTCVFQHECFSLDISGEMGERLAAHAGKAIFGIRPEGIEVADIGSSFSADQPATASSVIDVVEKMGSHSFLYLKAGKETITAKAPPDENFFPEQKIEYSFNTGNFHFFDSVTGQVL